MQNFMLSSIPSLLRGSTSKNGGFSRKSWVFQNILTVILANIRLSNCADLLDGSVLYRISRSINGCHLWRKHLRKRRGFYWKPLESCRILQFAVASEHPKHLKSRSTVEVVKFFLGNSFFFLEGCLERISLGNTRICKTSRFFAQNLHLLSNSPLKNGIRW